MVHPVRAHPGDIMASTAETTRSDGGRRARWTVVVLFAAAFAFAYLDRQILTLLIDPVRHSLGLNDTQVGLLQGFAFALCFAVGGIPLGWLVDNGNRVRVASGCVALWSIATASTGLASSYAQMLAVRSLTALSEAGCSPAALSIFADLFPPRLLPRATAIYTAAPYIGGSASLVAGGYLLAHFNTRGGIVVPVLGHLLPWQAVFACIGIPGLLLASIILLCVREPVRREDTCRPEDHTSLRDVLRFVTRDATYLPGYFCAYACILAAFFSLITWYPTYAIRSHFGTAASLGPTLGITFLASGLTGSLSGQWFVRGVADSEIVERVIRLVGRFSLLLIPATLLLVAGRQLPWSVFGYAVMVFVISTLTSLMPIPLQVGVPNRMRGRVIGCFIFGVNVVGTSIGPLLAGAISDRLARTSADAHALFLALSTVLLTFACAACLAIRRARAQLMRELKREPIQIHHSTDIAR
jgi:MFS family permease